ncbi:hypothetical protein [Streptomyces bambusae]|uniref:Uncharacterized protein n=1 Tax=Streptomyces bambusae TaxID=1550616 RepID=A0ABS6Z383_9ACTN|nr:hypothetical protein [Streptomyces bambusae]MBW5482177.1 hypothetical protein [Streptomyces bambusae]
MTALRLAPHTYVTFCKGLPLTTLAGIFAEAGLPAARDSGESRGWAWVAHPAWAADQDDRGATDLARDITGYRYADRVPAGPGAAAPETVFLASTPACDCPRGRYYFVPQCPEHPFQFQYSRGGFEQTAFNVGRRRESLRSGARADLLVRELLAAGIVGRDTPGYDADPDFNADGAHTVRIIADHFGLPSRPFGGGAPSGR